MSVCFLVGVAAAAVSISHFWSASGWPQRVPAQAFTTTKPKTEDVAGSYVIKGGSSPLDLNADGTFQATNYPIWNTTPSVHGSWALVTSGITYPNGKDAKDCWGIKLTAADGRVEVLDLTGNAVPYGLIRLSAEGDEGALFTFEKKE